MSFRCEGIEFEKLKLLWSLVQSKLSIEVSITLKHHLELVLANENDDKITHLTNFIGCCCENVPVNFEEFIAYVMIATGIELLNVSSTLFRMEKLRLLAHVFSTNIKWPHDQGMVI